MNPFAFLLLSCILSEETTVQKFILTAFSGDIDEHIREVCVCDLTDGGYGLCHVGQWYEGCMTHEQFLKEIDPPYLEELIEAHAISTYSHIFWGASK